MSVPNYKIFCENHNKFFYSYSNSGPPTECPIVASHPVGQVTQILYAFDNLEAVVPPTITDDIRDGYGIGSKWVDNLSGKTYTYVDGVENGAIWVLDITVASLPDILFVYTGAVNASSLQTSNGNVIISNAPPPNQGQVLIANSTSGASWGDMHDQSLNTTDDVVFNKLETDNSISCNKSIFGYPCPVSSVFYNSSVGVNLVATSIDEVNFSTGSITYGDTSIPSFQPGSIIDINMSGRVTTDGNDRVLVFLVYLDTPGGTSILLCKSSASYEIAKNVAGRHWELKIKIIPTDANFSTARLRSNGVFSYHATINDAKNTIEGFSITDSGYVTVLLQNPGKLRVAARWEEISNSSIVMLNTYYTYSGFNQ